MSATVPDTVVAGALSSVGCKVAVVAGRFNAFIVEKLVGGAIDALVRTGCQRDDVTVIWVPGAFDIPPVAKRVALGQAFDAVVCVGAVIRGGTPHFEYVAGMVSKGVAQVAMMADVPVTFGVITADTIDQAVERAGAKAGNKGFDAAMAAVEMVNLYHALGSGAPKSREAGASAREKR